VTTSAIVLAVVLVALVIALIMHGITHGIPGPVPLLNQAVGGCLFAGGALILFVLVLWLIRTLVAVSG
jgi:hypothetical protein